MAKLFTVFLTFLVSIGFTQNPDWQTITNINDVNDIAIHDSKIWAVSDGGAFIYNPSDESLERITNINGLKSVSLSAVETRIFRAKKKLAEKLKPWQKHL